MNITVNGLAESLADTSTVAALMSSRAMTAQGIAIAVNGEVVRAAMWSQVLLADGDLVEIVTARQGG